jgi:fructosamine-3-kinase
LSTLARKVAEVIGLGEERIEPLSPGGLSHVLLVTRLDGSLSVAKDGPAVGTEAAMLRAIAGAGVPAPLVEGEHEDLLLIEHVPNDGLFSARAWADIGTALARLHAHTGETHGWPVDFALGTVALDNRETRDWPRFWGEQRLVSTASLLDRPWRERIDRLAARLPDLLPADPPPSLLHGDLWTGNILVQDGKLAALIDPACCYGHAEVDLAMLCLFDAPPDEFREAYGLLDAGWQERRPVYQLHPALVHMRLFGPTYAPMADRLLAALGA